MPNIWHGLSKRLWRSWVAHTPCLPTRALSSTTFAPINSDQAQVSVGSSGSITLDIFHPPSPSLNAPAILYLPRGPLTLTCVPPEAPRLDKLALASNVTVIRLNYRLSPTHRYPTPIHDVLAGYDWVLRHLVRGDNGHRDLDKAFGRVGVCGELLGGSLAAALALTECSTRRAGVRAAVLGNPVSDWTAMHPVPKPGSAAVSAAAMAAAMAQPAKRRKSAKADTRSSWDAHAASRTLPVSALLRARTELFSNPADYFDPFASPLLFFKTAATEVPPRVDPIDEVFATFDMSLRAHEAKRRSVRRYPGSQAELKLPDTRMWVGEECALKDQGIELAQSVARSNNLYGGSQGKGEGSGWERVEVQVKDGIGLWGEKEFAVMGEWFGRVLRID